MHLDRTPWLMGKRRIVVWRTIATLLLLPLLVIELLDKRAGDPGDFVFAEILLAGVLLAFEIASRTPSPRAHVAGALMAITAALVLCWLNLSVGIVESEENPANLSFFAVPSVVSCGALIARFRPHGTAMTLVITAIAQVLVFLTLWAGGAGFTGPLTVFFVGVWLASACLFWKARGVRRS